MVAPMSAADPPPFTTPPSLADLEALARTAFAAIPVVLRRRAEGVVVKVEDLCDEDTERELGLESPYHLSGLYVGEPVHRKSVTHPLPVPDVVILYRLPILLEWCESGEDLTRLVRHVLIHEIGHHFGFSDAAMEAIERKGG